MLSTLLSVLLRVDKNYITFHIIIKDVHFSIKVNYRKVNKVSIIKIKSLQ